MPKRNYLSFSINDIIEDLECCTDDEFYDFYDRFKELAEKRKIIMEV